MEGTRAGGANARVACLRPYRQARCIEHCTHAITPMPASLFTSSSLLRPHNGEARGHSHITHAFTPRSRTASSRDRRAGREAAAGRACAPDLAWALAAEEAEGVVLTEGLNDASRDEQHEQQRDEHPRRRLHAPVDAHEAL